MSREYSPQNQRSQTKFIADAMLGRLAKWLRILGYDTLYYPEIDDRELIMRSVEEDRLILTRDTRLIKWRIARRHLFVREDDVRNQLRQVIAELGLDTSSLLFTRCCECNGELAPFEKGDALGRVPVYVYQTQEKFSICSNCKRIYWKGTHYARILEELKVIGVS